MYKNKNHGASFVGLILILFGIVVAVWLMVNLSNAVTRPATSAKEDTTIIDIASGIKDSLEENNLSSEE